MRKKPWEFIERAMFDVRDGEDADEPRMLVVTGIGGCGKTQLMLKFIQVHKNKSVISPGLF
jgi:GTPase SAR1 family protein